MRCAKPVPQPPKRTREPRHPLIRVPLPPHQALRARCGALGARASRFRAEAGALRGRVEAAAPEFEEAVRKALAVLLSAVQHDPLEEGEEPNDSGQEEDEPEEAGEALAGAATGAVTRAGCP
jgi:hypothetical protein